MVKHTRTKEEERRCCPPEKPVDNDKTSEKVEYANYVRNTKYKEVIQGRAQNVEVLNVLSSSISVRFEYVGYPREFIYQIEEPQTKTTTRYTVNASQGTTFTFNGLSHNTRYLINIYVKYVTITPYGLSSPISVRTPNEFKVTDFILSARNISVTVDFAQSPSNPPKYIVYLTDISGITVNQTVENVFLDDFQAPRKIVTFDNLVNDVSYSVYIDTFYYLDDGTQKQILRSATQTIRTLRENKIFDIQYSNITGNSVDLSFQPIEHENVSSYVIRFTEQNTTPDGVVDASTFIVHDDSEKNVTISDLKRNQLYRIDISNTYIQFNNTYENSFEFQTRNEGEVLNISNENDMYNAFGTITFSKSPFTETYLTYINDLSYITYDISYSANQVNSVHYSSVPFKQVNSVSDNIDSYTIGSLANPLLDISTTYYLYVRTKYYLHNGQINVYDASGVFQTLHEGPVQDISFTDINAYDVDISFSSIYTPVEYFVRLYNVRKASQIIKRIAYTSGVINVNFTNLINNREEYKVEVKSVFNNGHEYNLDSSFNTTNEGALDTIDFYHYDNSVNVFLDIFEPSYQDMSNAVVLYMNGISNEITFDSSYIYQNHYFQNDITLTNDVSSHTLSLHGVSSYFYLHWQDSKTNVYDTSYTITISNEHGINEQIQVPQYFGEEPIQPYNTKRSQLIDLGNKISNTTIAVSNATSNAVNIKNMYLYPVARTFADLSVNTVYDISLVNTFPVTNNSYTYETRFQTHNNFYMEDIHFSNHTGYTIDFEPSGNVHYDTFYRITEPNSDIVGEGEFPYLEDNVITVGNNPELKPDTSYNFEIIGKFIQLDLPFYPSYHYYVNYFHTSTLNESRINDLSFSTIRAETVTFNKTGLDVSGANDISRIDISFVNQVTGNIDVFQSTSDPQRTIHGLILDTSYALQVKHTYNSGNIYFSQGFPFKTKNQSGVKLLYNYLFTQSFIHRIDILKDTINDISYGTVLFQYNPAIGEPVKNTISIEDTSTDINYTDISNNPSREFVEIADFSGGGILRENTTYRFSVTTEYADGNEYITHDTVKIEETNILNTNFVLGVSAQLNYDENQDLYHNVPDHWSLHEGYVAFDESSDDPNGNPTIVETQNTGIPGNVVLLNHVAYPYKLSRLEQVITVQLLAQEYEIQYFAANLYNPNTRPIFATYQTNTNIYTDSNIRYHVFLEDILSGSPLENSYDDILDTSNNSTLWSKHQLKFSLNTKIPQDTVKLVIERVGYEYNMLGIMNVQLKTISKTNKDLSVGLRRSINNELSLIYNVEPIINQNEYYTTAQYYNVRIIYDDTPTLLTNSGKTVISHVLYIKDVSNSIEIPVDITGYNVPLLDGTIVPGYDVSGVNFGSYVGLKNGYLYTFYIITTYDDNSSNSSNEFGAYMNPLRSPVLLIENLEGDKSLVHRYLQNSSLDSTYRVEFKYRSAFGKQGSYTNEMYITNVTDDISQNTFIPTNTNTIVFQGKEDTKIEQLDENKTYRVKIVTAYNDGQTFETPEFDFSANFQSYHVQSTPTHTLVHLFDNLMYEFQADDTTINTQTPFQIQVQGLPNKLHFPSLGYVVVGSGGSGGSTNFFHTYNFTGGHGGWCENGYIQTTEDSSYNIYVASKSSGLSLSKHVLGGDTDVVGFQGLYSSIETMDGVYIVRADGGNGSFGSRTSDISINTFNSVQEKDICNNMVVYREVSPFRTYGRGGDYDPTNNNGTDGKTISFNGVPERYTTFQHIFGGGGGSSISGSSGGNGGGGDTGIPGSQCSGGGGGGGNTTGGSGVVYIWGTFTP
jgi:hypothetical protein